MNPIKAIKNLIHKVKKVAEVPLQYKDAYYFVVLMDRSKWRETGGYRDFGEYSPTFISRPILEKSAIKVEVRSRKSFLRLLKHKTQFGMIGYAKHKADAKKIAETANQKLREARA